MTANTTQPRKWPRLWIGAAFVLAGQAALILFLNKEPDPMQAKSAPRALFHVLTNADAAELAVVDPTLFALPHDQGFSAGVWTRILPFAPRPREWVGTNRWLALSTDDLGAEFARYMETNSAAVFPVLAMAGPEPVFPVLPPEQPFSNPSTFRIEGELASRKLLSSFLPSDLGAWTNKDLLANTTVQVVVDGRGSALSAVLLKPYSGSDEADSNAVRLARSARFEPVVNLRAGQNPATMLAFGTFVFQWRTLPPASTNAAAPSQ